MPGNGGDEAGFTLIEVMISLALFGLIAVAGLALVSGILNVREHTEVRLDRLGQLQRAMLVLENDLDQVTNGKIVSGGTDIAFTRVGPAAGSAPVEVRYAVVGGALVRLIGARSQVLLPGVQAARWRFYDQSEWANGWPRDARRPGLWPRAIEVQVALAGSPGGTLRRLVELPVQAVPPPEPTPTASPAPGEGNGPGPIGPIR
ncbi:MAG: prepilin-type N-terminal cleavage/methylation domain-containing protein [Sphingomonas sp.]|nr:prepilin-type N-terminal cleavage/methylation domain-containing protein [Sphingomonas sp.]